MKINNISSSNQNFYGVSKAITTFNYGKTKTQIIEFLGDRGNNVGIQLRLGNGDVQGYRQFSNNTRFSYDTIHGHLNKERLVSLAYITDFGKQNGVFKYYVCNFKKFKEHIDELVTLKGIKNFIADIKKHPDTREITWSTDPHVCFNK